MTGERVHPQFAAALVTGGTGFIGARLANRLADAGVKTAATVRIGSDPRRIAALSRAVRPHTVGGSAASLAAVFGGAGPEVVFHLAARFDPRQEPEDPEGLAADNIDFTRAVCDAAIEAGCSTLVAAGTAWQNAGSASGDPTPAPNTPYAESKQAAEEIIAARAANSGLNATSLKIYDTYGPGDRRVRFVNALADAARNGATLPAVPGDQRLHMVHVDDVCDAFIHAANRLVSGADRGHNSYTLPSAKPISLRQLAETWKTATGCDVEVAWGALAYRPGTIMTPWEGRALPGWTPRVDLAAGLAELQG